MNIELMLVADAINASADGKINMLGQFDSINALGFPAQHRQLSLWIRLGTEPQDVGKTFTTELRLLDPDGKLLFSIERPFLVPAPPTAGIWRSGVNIVVPMPDLVFPTAGDYAFTFEIDGKEKGRAPFSLTLVQAPGLNA